MQPEEMMQALQKPFKYDEIEWLVKIANKQTSTGLALPYVTARAIQNRLDEVCGIDGWKNEFVEWKDKSQLCGISIKFGNEWVTKFDGADDTMTDGTKGGLSGSMKRAACAWGIGRYLYQLPQMWTDITIKTGKNGKDTYSIKKKPQLPKWALPDNANKNKKNEVKWNTEDDFMPEIPENVQACLDSFKKLNISQGDIENYFCKEAFLISDEELEELRRIYIKLINKQANKEQYFFTDKSDEVTTQNSVKVEQKLLLKKEV